MKGYLTFSYFSCFIIMGFVTAAIGPSLPEFAKNTNVELSVTGILFSTFFFGMLIGCLLGGRLLMSISGHYILVLGLFGIGLIIALISSISWIWGLALAWGGIGIFEGFLEVGTNTLLLRVHQTNAGPFMNAAHFFFGLGALLIPVFIALSIQHTTEIHWAYWMMGLASIPLGVLLLLLPSPSLSRQTGEQTGKITNYRVVLYISVFLFFYVGAEVSFGGWISSYALKKDIATIATSAYFSSIFWGTLTLGRLLGIPLAKHFSPSIILSISVIGCFLSAGYVYWGAISLIPLVVGTTAMGLSMSLIFPSSFTFMAQRITVTGQVSSWCLVGAGLGGMFFPWWIGQFLGI